MAVRNDLELVLVLTNPFEARHYIQHFDWRTPYIPDAIEVDTGRLIHLENISDEDAVVVALFLLRQYQIPREETAVKLEKFIN